MNHVYNIAAFKTLLANTLREKTDGYLVNELFSRFSSIQELLDVTEEELMAIKGIGPVKAQQIIAALKLASVKIKRKLLKKINRKFPSKSYFIRPLGGGNKDYSFGCSSCPSGRKKPAFFFSLMR
ncbi:helix-hairpin-helix domain-containing protein [Brevibacillus sp. WF146]|uniref:helix-hairpin-helix domain-containing protein n=1 Tax=Brevibacillus sp. WF146 TaxID=319501 RepID=UPI0022266DAB|nr:helix-hairpin-helix domain-containing protein [Brevibacillus sp. WF146]UYZ13736.1 helix-hairpin-helix domain-containing protein [Brevibacillus sp. WF146]